MRVKMSKKPQPVPTASAVGPCPTISQIRRTPRHWKFTQHHRTTTATDGIVGEITSINSILSSRSGVKYNISRFSISRTQIFQSTLLNHVNQRI